MGGVHHVYQTNLIATEPALAFIHLMNSLFHYRRPG